MDVKNLFLVIILFGGIFTAWAFFTAYRNWKRDMDAPEKVTKATVADKRSSVPVREYNSVRRQSARYYVTFRTEEGESVELLVSQADFFALLADAEVYLTYKGGRIVDWKKAE